jgi:hypothetical protein
MHIPHAPPIKINPSPEENPQPQTKLPTNVSAKEETHPSKHRKKTEHQHTNSQPAQKMIDWIPPPCRPSMSGGIEEAAKGKSGREKG